jgi:hypothetical protein
MSLYAFSVLGVFLLVAPWTPVWGRATTALLPEALAGWVHTGWVRGVVSGVGALDLVVALQLAVELWRSMRIERERRS